VQMPFYGFTFHPPFITYKFEANYIRKAPVFKVINRCTETT
jgi:hypothetical protein